MRIRRLSPALARRQAGWIVAMDPWKSMEYAEKALGAYFSRKAKAREVWAVMESDTVCAVMVLQPEFLLGAFIALLAVRAESAGQGYGQALIAKAESETFGRRRWLYVSSDWKNTRAARFYRKAGFRRIASLPDLVREGRVEWLWRKARPVKSP